jgi:hypothetical protein
MNAYKHPETFFKGAPVPQVPTGPLIPRRPQATDPEPFGLFDQNAGQRHELAQLPLTLTEAKP